MSNTFKIGDKVRYYNYTSTNYEVGIITALDVEVTYIGSFSKHPYGVEIDGRDADWNDPVTGKPFRCGLRRPYDEVSLINS